MTFCGVFSMTFQNLVCGVEVPAFLTRSTLPSQHIVLHLSYLL